MKKHVEERTIRIARYMVAHKCTLRELEDAFPENSRSTYYRDIEDRLPLLNPGLYGLVKMLMRSNDMEKSAKGGRKSPGERFTTARELAVAGKKVASGTCDL